MKFLEFIELVEAKQIFFGDTKSPPGGIMIYTSRRQPPNTAILPQDNKPASQSEDLVVVRAKVRTGNQMNRELIRRREQDEQWQTAWYGWGRGHVDLNLLQQYPQVFSFKKLTGQAAFYRYMTTDIGMDRSTYEQVIGPAPEDMGDEAVNFHGARLFLPTNMSKRGIQAATNTLEAVYQHLADSGTGFLFADSDIRFKRLPSNIGGNYDPNTGDMNVNPNIKNPPQTIYSLLHEFGHMLYYEYFGVNTRKEIADKFEDIKLEGEGYAGNVDYFMQLQDAMEKIEAGMPIVYKGRKQAWKRMGDMVVKHTGMHGDIPSVWIDRAAGGPAGRVALQNALNPKMWQLPVDINLEKPSEFTRKTDDWFPTHYSENAPRNNLEGEEWFAELFAFHSLGNLGGEPNAWVSSVIKPYRKQQLAATVGSNEGDVNNDMPPVAHGDEEGNASWDWTDPYHSSGAENAVMSRTP